MVVFRAGHLMERDKINSFSPHDIAPRAIPLVDDPLDDCTRSDLHCQMEPYSVLTAESSSFCLLFLASFGLVFASFYSRRSIRFRFFS